MTKKHRVAIADPDESALQTLENCLDHLGHRVIAKADSPIGLIELCKETELDLIIGELKSEEAMLALSQISPLHCVPAITTASDVNSDLLERNIAHQVFGVLVKPFREADLSATLAVVAQRFHEFNQLHDEACSLRKALDDRKVIERAKGLVMKKCGLDEASAFRHLQHLARQHRQKIVDIAKGILIAENVFASVN